jgi:hypothetical protein
LLRPKSAKRCRRIEIAFGPHQHLLQQEAGLALERAQIPAACEVGTRIKAMHHSVAVAERGAAFVAGALAQLNLVLRPFF